MSDVFTIYSIANCKYCDMAKDMLRANNKVFSEIAIDIKPRIAREITKRAGMNTVPIIYHGGNLIGGYTELVAYIKNEEE